MIFPSIWLASAQISHLIALEKNNDKKVKQKKIQGTQRKIRRHLTRYLPSVGHVLKPSKSLFFPCLTTTQITGNTGGKR